MRHPTKKQMQKVIDRLKTILPMAKKREQLEMMEGRVFCESHLCGTVHCFGGWYAVACRARKVIKKRISFADCNYQHGADLMAEDLGFGCRLDLMDWARDNPKIWGNVEGEGIFCDAIAFNNAKTMRGVVQHLERVLKRLPK